LLRAAKMVVAAGSAGVRLLLVLPQVMLAGLLRCERLNASYVLRCRR